MQLSSKDQKFLLDLAFNSAREYILFEKRITIDPTMVPEMLCIPCGSFVSAYVKDQLRGCLGSFSEEESLFLVVQNMSVAAVSRDMRFDPVKKDEIEKLEMEISVLSPREQVKDISRIEIGKHGIYLVKGTRRGTFLPQVALDQKWNTEQFLRHCSRYKADLGWDGWKTADIYTYETILISSRKTSKPTE